MKTYQEYIDNIFTFAKVDLYITDKTDNVNKEIAENCVKIGVPEHLIKDIDPLTFSIFLSSVKQNAKDQLTKSDLNVKLIFYVWLDEQAGQLRYNFINSNHEKIPFVAELNFVDDAHIVCKAWVDRMQNSTFLPDNKVMIYKYLISKKQTYKFEPYVGLGALKFGMTMDEARAAINLPYSSFNKSMDSHSPADSFDNGATIVFYDIENKVNAIEVYPEVNFVFNDYYVFGKRITEFEKWLAPIATDFKREDDGVGGADVRSIGMSYSGWEDPEDERFLNVGYIFLYKKGYWDEYEASLPKSWEWKPKVSVGPINFGMTRTEVRSQIESPLTETNFIDDETNLADDYLELGLRICYNANGGCRLVQCTNENRISINYLFLKGMNVGGLTRLMEILSGQDPKIIYDITGCDSAALGLFIVNSGYTEEATKYAQMNSITFSNE